MSKYQYETELCAAIQMYKSNIAPTTEGCRIFSYLFDPEGDRSCLGIYLTDIPYREFIWAITSLTMFKSMLGFSEFSYTTFASKMPNYGVVELGKHTIVFFPDISGTEF
jgi:hypothetical protein